MRNQGIIEINGVVMRQVPKFGRYAVNRLGLVFDIEEGWFVLSDLTSEGYGTLRLRRDDGVWGRVYCHEFSARAWLSNPRRRKRVEHFSLNKTDNSYENLDWVKGESMAMEVGLRNRAEMTSEIKDKIRQGVSGELNYRFTGYWVTELGRFDSLEGAALVHGVHKTTMLRRFRRGFVGYGFEEK